MWKRITGRVGVSHEGCMKGHGSDDTGNGSQGVFTWQDLENGKQGLTKDINKAKLALGR